MLVIIYYGNHFSSIVIWLDTRNTARMARIYISLKAKADKNVFENTVVNSVSVMLY